MIQWKEFLLGYEISNTGEIRNVKTKKILKSFINNGYLSIRIKNKNFTGLVHRIVLIAFKPIEDNKNYVVNHIDGNTLNNNIDNLEWCTQKENIYHSKNITCNGAVISKQKILNIYEKNKNMSIDDFVKLIITSCK